MLGVIRETYCDAAYYYYFYFYYYTIGDLNQVDESRTGHTAVDEGKIW